MYREHCAVIVAIAHLSC